MSSLVDKFKNFIKTVNKYRKKYYGSELLIVSISIMIYGIYVLYRYKETNNDEILYNGIIIMLISFIFLWLGYYKYKNKNKRKILLTNILFP